MSNVSRGCRWNAYSYMGIYASTVLCLYVSVYVFIYICIYVYITGFEHDTRTTVVCSQSTPIVIVVLYLQWIFLAWAKRCDDFSFELWFVAIISARYSLLIRTIVFFFFIIYKYVFALSFYSVLFLFFCLFFCLSLSSKRAWTWTFHYSLRISLNRNKFFSTGYTAIFFLSFPFLFIYLFFFSFLNFSIETYISFLRHLFYSSRDVFSVSTLTHALNVTMNYKAMNERTDECTWEYIGSRRDSLSRSKRLFSNNVSSPRSRIRTTI